MTSPAEKITHCALVAAATIPLVVGAYHLIAAIEGIHDARAAQVSAMHAAVMAIFWAYSTVVAAVDARRDPSAFRRFAVGSVAAAAVMCAVAALDAVVVTPPTAMLASVTVGLGAALLVGIDRRGAG